MGTLDEFSHLHDGNHDSSIRLFNDPPTPRKTPALPAHDCKLWGKMKYRLPWETYDSFSCGKAGFGIDNIYLHYNACHVDHPDKPFFPRPSGRQSGRASVSV